MEQFLSCQIIEATLNGDLWIIESCLGTRGGTYDPRDQILPFEHVHDSRGFNPLDLVWERIQWGWKRDQDLSFLTPVTLAMILKKCAMVSTQGLQMLYGPHELRTFSPARQKRACREHTLGLLALAAIGFNKLGQNRVSVSEHWAIERLSSLLRAYGNPANATPQLLHEGFMPYLETGEAQHLNAFSQKLQTEIGDIRGPANLLLAVLNQTGNQHCTQPAGVQVTGDNPVYGPVAHIDSQRFGQWAHVPDLAMHHLLEEPKALLDLA